jgi:Cu2+-containing amine oxidase
MAALAEAQSPLPVDFPPHPLDPLTAGEMEQAAGLCRAFFKQRFTGAGELRFNSFLLQEPRKKELVDWEKLGDPTAPMDRRAFCILQVRATVCGGSA